MENKIFQDMQIKGLIRIDRKPRSQKLADIIRYTNALLPNQQSIDNFRKLENTFVWYLENLDLEGFIISQN